MVRFGRAAKFRPKLRVRDGRQGAGCGIINTWMREEQVRLRRQRDHGKLIDSFADDWRITRSGYISVRTRWRSATRMFDKLLCRSSSLEKFRVKSQETLSSQRTRSLFPEQGNRHPTRFSVPVLGLTSPFRLKELLCPERTKCAAWQSQPAMGRV